MSRTRNTALAFAATLAAGILAVSLPAGTGSAADPQPSPSFGIPSGETFRPGSPSPVPTFGIPGNETFRTCLPRLGHPCR